MGPHIIALMGEYTRGPRALAGDPEDRVSEMVQATPRLQRDNGPRRHVPLDGAVLLKVKT